MKLYELPNQTYFVLMRDMVADNEAIEKFFFDHIDGMYSYCLDEKQNVIHFAAWTEVQPMP